MNFQIGTPNKNINGIISRKINERNYKKEKYKIKRI